MNDHTLTMRFTPKFKRNITMLIDWFGKHGCANAAKIVMGHYNISPDELAEWRQT